MHQRPLRLLLALALALPVAAQGAQFIGHRAVAWPNTTGAGTAVLDSVVYYPATADGADTPVAPNAGGWPVVVFLHGFGLLGSTYTELATAWAGAGFVVVLGETSQWDYFGQADDGRALHAAVIAADAEVGGPFENAFDAQRMAIVGHSMGGANVANVLIGNPGYRCGLAFAPIAPLGSDLTQVHVPFGILAGAGDWVTPWDWNAMPVYLSLTQHGSFKFLRVFGDDCGHMNLVGLESTAPEMLEASTKTSIGFLRHSLGLSASALEQVFGPVAMNFPDDPHTYREVVVPQMWLSGPLHPGVRARVSVAVDNGPAVLFAAAGLIPGVQTIFGLLRLDPGTAFPAAIGISDAEGRADMPLDVPPDPTLIGLAVALQGSGAGLGSQFVLGSAALVYIE